SGTATLHVNAAPPPPPPVLPPTRFAELHYDNYGTDVGEAIEVEGPAGSSVDGWTVVLYDNTGNPDGTSTLAGSIPATCGDRGVVVLNYPQDGIRNSSPNGLALVDGGGHVIEFLSYEGTETAKSGPASGMVSTDIGVAEPDEIGQSLQRDASNHWAI